MWISSPLISIKTSSSVENSKLVLYSEAYFCDKFSDLISSKCKEAAKILL